MSDLLAVEDENSAPDDMSKRRLALIGMGAIAISAGLSGCREAKDADSRSNCQEDCDPKKDVPKDGVALTEEELDAAAILLWAEFERGTTAVTESTNPMPLEPGVKADREAYHRNILATNSKLWARCKRLTKRCAYNAGVVSATMAQHAGQTKISLDCFQKSAYLWKVLEANRTGKIVGDIGIVC